MQNSSLPSSFASLPNSTQDSSLPTSYQSLPNSQYTMQDSSLSNSYQTTTSQMSLSNSGYLYPQAMSQAHPPSLSISTGGSISTKIKEDPAEEATSRASLSKSQSSKNSNIIYTDVKFHLEDPDKFYHIPKKILGENEWEFHVENVTSTDGVVTVCRKDTRRRKKQRKNSNDLTPSSPEEYSQPKSKEKGSVKVFTEISPNTLRKMLYRKLTVKDIIATKPPHKIPAKITDFELLDVIGLGRNSITHLCRYKENNTYYALKVFKRSVIISSKQMEQITNENSILSSLTHPGIIKMFTTFTTIEAFYSLLEFIPGGDLFMYIRNNNRLSNEQAKFYTAQIVLVLEYLHQQKIAIRDLKPENISLDINGNVKFVDFCLAKVIEDRTYTVCGTPGYIAPEIISSNSGYTTAVDLWSLGILVYEMLAGFPPFTNDSLTTINFSNISFPPYFEEEALDFIQSLLVEDPSCRLGASIGGYMELKNHSWFKTPPSINWDIIKTWKDPGPIIPSVNSPLENYQHMKQLSEQTKIFN